MTDYVTKDSGEKAEYGDGMRRDTTKGKPMFALMFPRGIPYAEQLMTRVAALYARGAEKYGGRNWERSRTEESLAHHEESLMRHVVEFLTGTEDGEDHAAAIVWNVNAVDLTRRNLKPREAEEEVKPSVNSVAAAADRDLWALRTYVFPFPDPDHPGWYRERAVQAFSYEDAKSRFDQWVVDERRRRDNRLR